MNIHIFIDAENMPPKAALESYDFLKAEHNVYRCDVVGKWMTIPRAYKAYLSRKFQIQNSDFGKNSADLWLTVMIARAIYEEPELELLAIFSNDRDFAPVINLAVEKKKQVLLLVMESQYKGIKDTLQKMRIDKNFFTLGILKEEAKFVSIKVSHLQPELRAYYMGRYREEHIFAKRDEQFIELPFINGMEVSQFTHLMRSCRVWPKSKKAAQSVGELSLKIENNRVWYQTEEELGMRNAE